MKLFNGFYLPRGKNAFRNVLNEIQLQKLLFKHFNIVPFPLECFSLHTHQSILCSADLLIHVSGSAGLAAINCPVTTTVIEISPQSVFLSDVERHDALTRGGRHIVYVCDRQSVEVAPIGDPLWMYIDPVRLFSAINQYIEER